MMCPTCTDERLVITERSGIEIDYCPSCRGVWLDRGELDKLIERGAVMLAPPAQPVAAMPAPMSAPMPAPAAPMPASVAPPASRRWDDDDDDDDDDDRKYRSYSGSDSHKPHKKKRGGFLGDLFDF